jgi:hypothetical protein
MVTFQFWDRNVSGDLIPQSGTVTIENTALVNEALKLKAKALQSEEKQAAVYNRAAEMLLQAVATERQELKILYTPLLHCELKAHVGGLNCAGTDRAKDASADICATHCVEPKYTYDEWQSMKDYRVKDAIASFIVDASIPKREVTEAEKAVFQMLRELVDDTGLTSSDTVSSISEGSPSTKSQN